MAPKSTSSKKRARSSPGDSSSSSSSSSSEASKIKIRRIHFDAMAALLRDEKGPDDAELEPECEEVREEWMKKWSGSMIAQLEALVDVEAEADADADPNVYAHADPKQLQRIDTLKASVAVVYQRVQRLRTKVLGKGGRMWKGYLEESRPEEPEEPAQPPAVSEVVKSQDLTTMRKSMNTALATVKKLDGELSAAVKSLSTTVEGANKSLGMTSTAEEIMSAATSNGGSSSADASSSSSSSSSASTGLGLDVPAGASSKFAAHMQGRLR